MQEVFAIHKQASGIIITSGLADRDKDHAVLGQIQAYLTEHSGCGVWYGSGNPLDRETHVIDTATSEPRPATAAELAQMPEGRRKSRRADATARMEAIAAMGHGDVDAWLSGVFNQLPDDERDALAWIENNVTNLASAKTALTKITAALYDQRETTRTLAHVLLAVIRRLDWSESE